MNASNLVSISSMFSKMGAKVLLHGPPGSGKTPMAMALQRAVACITEPGLSSARGAQHMPGQFCSNFKELDDFFKWFCNPTAKDVSQFDTLIVDSFTKLCDIVLKFEQGRNKDGRAAYGKMAEYVMGIVDSLQVMPNMNVVLISQMTVEEIVVPGALPIPGQIQTRNYNVPLFPGRVLSEKIPHVLDEILYSHIGNRPDGTYGPMIATTDTGIAMARSRCGRLNPIEPPDLNYIFSKINS